jgi:hypothetical protein
MHKNVSFLPLWGGGGRGFHEKLPEGSPNFGFYFIFYLKVFWNLPGGGYVYPSPPPAPLCAYIYSTDNGLQMEFHIGKTLHKKYFGHIIEIEKFEWLW